MDLDTFIGSIDNPSLLARAKSTPKPILPQLIKHSNEQVVSLSFIIVHLECRNCGRHHDIFNDLLLVHQASGRRVATTKSIGDYIGVPTEVVHREHWCAACPECFPGASEEIHHLPSHDSPSDDQREEQGVGSVEANDLHLRSGSGSSSGSDPDNEWPDLGGESGSILRDNGSPSSDVVIGSPERDATIEEILDAPPSPSE